MRNSTEIFVQICQAHAASVQEYISGHDVLNRWPPLQKELSKSLSAESAWKLALPVLACEALGGESDEALPAAAAWLCLRHAAHLINAGTDLEFNTANQTGLATGLIFAGFQFVGELEDAAVIKRVLKEYSSAGLHSVFGNSIFASSNSFTGYREDSLELYWQAVILKSGSIFQAGAAGGAAIASSRQDRINALGDYGSALGVMLQVLDDCRDRSVDQLKRATLPGLPALLENLLIGAGEKALPETLSTILLEWQRHALKALSDLPNSPALEILRQVPDDILNMTQVG